jgi:hypothetical protein
MRRESTAPRTEFFFGVTSISKVTVIQIPDINTLDAGMNLCREHSAYKFENILIICLQVCYADLLVYIFRIILHVKL